MGAVAAYMAPDQVIRSDAQAATEIARVVREQGLSKTISGREYLTAEAWSMVGRVLGLAVTVDDPQPFTDTYNQTGYACRAHVHDRHGVLIATASAICTRNERRWSNADEYAIFSMAQTRAVGKAHRVGLSAIAVLAGFQATPAEEAEITTNLADPVASAPGAPMPRRRASALDKDAIRYASGALTADERNAIIRPYTSEGMLYADVVPEVLEALASAQREIVEAAADAEEAAVVASFEAEAVLEDQP